MKSYMWRLLSWMCFSVSLVAIGSFFKLYLFIKKGRSIFFYSKLLLQTKQVIPGCFVSCKFIQFRVTHLKNEVNISWGKLRLKFEVTYALDVCSCYPTRSLLLPLTNTTLVSCCNLNSLLIFFTERYRLKYTLAFLVNHDVIRFSFELWIKQLCKMIWNIVC